MAFMMAWVPPSAAAQAPHGWEPSDAFGDMAYLGLNTLLGAVTAGVINRIHGRPFKDAAMAGAAGGGLEFAGKRLAAARFTGAGLMGREVGAVGASAVRNASEGRAAFDELMLPLGPIRFYVRPGGGGLSAVRLSLPEAATLIWAATHPDLRLLWGESFSSGAPVFEAPGRTIRIDRVEMANGVAVNGVIVLEGRWREGPRFILAHERVHVLQRDFAGHAWSGPFDRWVLDRTDLTSALGRWVDPGLLVFPIYALGFVSDMVEGEAEFLETR